MNEKDERKKNSLSLQINKTMKNTFQSMVDVFLLLFSQFYLLSLMREKIRTDDSETFIVHCIYANDQTINFSRLFFRLYSKTTLTFDAQQKQHQCRRRQQTKTIIIIKYE